MVSLATSPFSASSSWNTLLPANSSFTKLNWPGSTGYNYGVAWDSYSPSVYVASASDPVVQVNYPAGWGYPGGTVSVHMPAAANGATGTDGELIVIDADIAYNFWQFNRTGTTTATALAFGADNVVTGDGWGSKSPFLSAGTTAVGASELGGLLVKAETDDGSIDHALQLGVDFSLVMPGFTGNAINGDGGSSSGIVKEGQLLAISPNTPMPSGLSKLGQEVFTAMQKYGAYVVDVAGGTTMLRAQANAYDAATITALNQDMGKIMTLLQGVTPGSGGSSGGAASGGTSVPTTPVHPVPTPTGGTSATASNLFGSTTHDVHSAGGEVYALYDAILGRTPDPLGFERWASTLTHGTASLHDVAASFLASPEGQSHVGSPNNATFVEQLYETALHRPGGTNEVQQWTNALNQGASRADVAIGFALSAENVAGMQTSLNAGVFVPDQNAANVARLYYGVLGRAPDSSGFSGWTGKVDGGSSSFKDLAQALLNSPEYQNAHAGRSDSQFVDSLYVNALGRHAESAGLQQWVDALSHGASRADVALGISESQEAQQHHLSQIEQGWLLA